jgi:hypothetical protein
VPSTSGTTWSRYRRAQPPDPSSEGAGSTAIPLVAWSLYKIRCGSGGCQPASCTEPEAGRRRRTDDGDFDEAAPPLRRLQIIGHEFGHIIFDDEGVPVQPEQLATLLPPDDLPEATVSANARTLTACTRTAYDDLIEQRCEWFGTVVVQRLTTGATRP